MCGARGRGRAAWARGKGAGAGQDGANGLFVTDSPASPIRRQYVHELQTISFLKQLITPQLRLVSQGSSTHQ